jgi:DNA-binding phage protein
MPKYNQDIEDRILFALGAIEAQEKRNISKVAREFGLNA